MKLKPIVIIGISLIVLYALARFTGFVQFYKNETPVLEPALKAGSLVIASNFISPKRYSIVAFDVNPYSEKNGMNIPSVESTHLSRIIGLENEEIQIEDGLVFINSKKVDPPFEVQFMYKMKSVDFENYRDKYQLKSIYELQPDVEYALLYLNSSEAEKILEISEIEKIDAPISGGDLYQLSEIVEPGWTTNNFGPITVPKGHYFMIGDNRNNSLDSRYFGFISKEKITGVKI